MPDAKRDAASVVVHKKTLCRACRICELICSATHDGACGAHLSRIHIVSDDFGFSFPATICAQCKSAECHGACPRADRALCIDRDTGTRYIDESECDGCGSCAEACPLPRSPIWSKRAGEAAVFFKCDLCRDIEGGPQCVEMCPWDALVHKQRKAR
jgi:anaerobic carbon-monoxide dehydrogenase iron sulfur subunit